MRKYQIIENVKIDALGYGGVGIARLPNGKKLLIKGALPESVVDVTIVKSKKDYLEGHILRVHQVAPSWLDGEVKCPHYLFSYQANHDLPSVEEHKKGCGGCKRQVVSYSKQLELKQAIVRDCFQKFIQAHGDIEIAPVLPSPLQRGYRNKIEFSFGKYLKKTPADRSLSQQGEDAFAIAQHRQLGFHKQGEFSKVVDIDQCYLVSSVMHQVYTTLKSSLVNSGLPVHDVVTHQGFLRHFVIREGVHTGQCLVNLSVATDHFLVHPGDQQIREQLLADWKQDSRLQEYITTLVITENNGLADIVHGQDTKYFPVWGEGRIFEALHFTPAEEAKETITRFQVSPFSFFQTNTLGAETLFGKAYEMVGRVPGNIIDLYCGSGSIGLSFLALGLGSKLKGIEIVPSAVHDAYENAKINGLGDRSEFYIGKAEQLLKDGVIDETFFTGDDLIVVDPPRDGLHPKVVEFLITCRQRWQCKLLYISCNPITMARDIALLVEGGYRLPALQPVDMFPHTHHIECIGLLR